MDFAPERNKINDLKAYYDRCGLTAGLIRQFRDLIYDYFACNGRRFPWRETTEPYHIVVSEIMLQQTQTERVTSKFEKFIQTFPSFEALDRAQLHEVLSEWQGLGYNRRAKALKQLAHVVVSVHSGELPQDPKILVTFPGLGKATAASIAVFAFNRPEIFIETNIRTVFILCFFNEHQVVGDDELLPLVAATLDRENPRSWYNALMDYGSFLKRTTPAVNKRSRHYSGQSPFKGSNRELRGAILRWLLNNSGGSVSSLKQALNFDSNRIDLLLSELQREGFVIVDDHSIRLC